MSENVVHIFIAIISALGSVGAWRFYETKLKLKSDRESSSQQANENFISDFEGIINFIDRKYSETERWWVQYDILNIFWNFIPRSLNIYFIYL